MLLKPNSRTIEITQEATIKSSELRAYSQVFLHHYFTGKEMLSILSEGIY